MYWSADRSTSVHQCHSSPAHQTPRYGWSQTVFHQTQPGSMRNSTLLPAAPHSAATHPHRSDAPDSVRQLPCALQSPRPRGANCTDPSLRRTRSSWHWHPQHPLLPGHEYQSSSVHTAYAPARGPYSRLHRLRWY